MLEQFKGKSEEEIKTSIDQLSQSDLQNLIEESKNMGVKDLVELVLNTTGLLKEYEDNPSLENDLK